VIPEVLDGVRDYLTGLTGGCGYLAGLTDIADDIRDYLT